MDGVEMEPLLPVMESQDLVSVWRLVSSLIFTSLGLDVFR